MSWCNVGPRNRRTDTAPSSQICASNTWIWDLFVLTACLLIPSNHPAAPAPEVKAQSKKMCKNRIPHAGLETRTPDHPTSYTTRTRKQANQRR